MVFSPAEMEFLAERFNLSVAEIERTSFGYADDRLRRVVNATTIPQCDVVRAQRRFAPAGLALGPHIRTTWQLKPFPFCEESWQELIHICPTCQTPQGWRATTVVYCNNCYEDLRLIQAPYVPENERASLKSAIGLVHHDPKRVALSLTQLPDTLSIEPAAAVELLVRLLPVLEPQIRGKRPEFLSKATSSQINSAMAKAWNLLLGWPDAPRALFRQHIIRSEGKQQDGNDGQNNFFLNLGDHKFLLPETADAIRQLNDYCSAPTKLPSPADARLMSPTEVIRRLGPKFSVVKARQSSVLGTEFATHNGFAAPMHFSSEIEALAKERADRISFGSAAERLGLPHYAIRQFADAGFIEKLYHPYFEFRFNAGQLSCASVNRLEERLKVEATTLPTERIMLVHAAKVFGGGMKPWANILSLLLTGGIDFEVEPNRPLFKSIFIKQSDASSLLSCGSVIPLAKKDESLISRDAAEILNLTPRKTIPLLGKALSRSMSSAKLVCPIHVQKIAGAFMSVPELAARLSMNAPAVYRLVERQGMQSHQPPGYPRAEAEKFMRRLG